MNRGKNLKNSIPHSMVDFYVAVLGNTTNPPTVPLNGDFRPTTSTYPVRANGVSKVAAEAPTRTSAGIYVITYAHQLPNVMFADGAVYKAGASPTALLVADVTIIDAAARQITVKTSTSAGVLTDLGVNDMLVIVCQAQDSGV